MRWLEIKLENGCEPFATASEDSENCCYYLYFRVDINMNRGNAIWSLSSKWQDMRVDNIGSNVAINMLNGCFRNDSLRWWVSTIRLKTNINFLFNSETLHNTHMLFNELRLDVYSSLPFIHECVLRQTWKWYNVRKLFRFEAKLILISMSGTPTERDYIPRKQILRYSLCWLFFFQ